ncbi:1-deoxy-D-xylulose-5-phosphate synthase [Clostridium sp. UBA4548]|uniref:1-deoxy-D-xylulose-5-phosphate synthase n=1 Tax=Clostridium sp. UBA4548 TaxID=1946361 RepID=UPI0025C5BE3E|nr:1-deoxy-D-xylulose-5-phosphate synthase [Clostridium sp. UBA4548]
MGKYLESYNDFNEIKNMNIKELNLFAEEIREFLIEKVSKTGGHLASNLGVVELTLSLYNVFNFDKDKLIWDVGHQSYVHKILTGRKDQFETLRTFGGLSGFPKKEESKYDMFDTGHSSTSISAAVGMARARDLHGDKYDVVAVIGDGALTGGMALEALNDVGYNKSKMTIILNDNQMSISKNVGGLSTYLSELRMGTIYNRFKNDFNSTIEKIPGVGKGVVNSINKIKDSLKQLVVPGMLFEDMGIKYYGPIDGHNIKELSKAFKNAQKVQGPVLIHVITTKGKGYKYAEKFPHKFHGVGPFDCDSGEFSSSGNKSYSSVFGTSLIQAAEVNKNVVAITAAMPEGTGLDGFAKKYPKRFFDVGIAEQHAVTMAAGMAAQGLRPVFAVYSTFLQRAYDQILHDVAIQKLPVIFAIDRAGIVGQDGETHQGIFDLSYLSHMPNMTIMSPKCTDEMKTMINFALTQNYPIAIRYPRGGDGCNIHLSPMTTFKKGKWEVVTEKQGKVAIIATGKMVQNAVIVKEKLQRVGIECTVVNACFIKPIDKNLIQQFIDEGFSFVTIEDNVITGGLGSLVLQFISTKSSKTKVLNLGFKDEFVPHGNVDILYKIYNLDVDGIYSSILNML